MLVEVQHGVGIFATALVHQTVNVDIVGSNGGGEPAQGVGDVPVENGDAACGLADTHVAVGVVDGIDDVAVFQVVHHFLHSHHSAVVLGFFGGGTQVGDGNAAGHTRSLLVGEVGDILCHLAGGQSLCHGIVVYQLIPGEVQNDDAVLHLGKSFGIDHLLGVLQQGDMEGDDIAVGIDLLPGLDPLHMAVQVPGSFHADVGVAAVDIHAQLPCTVGQGAADGTQADDAQLLAVNFVTCELGLALFHQLGNVGAALDGLDPVDAAHDVPAGQEHAAQSQLHNASCIGTGGVEYHDALLGTGGQGNVVDTGTGPGNGQQIFGQFHVMHGCAADQNGIGIGGIVHQLILVGPLLGALGGDFI